MKLYKLSILALALAGTMAACSDDDYNAPAATPGAFFPVESPDMVVLPFDGNTVEITMRRNTPNIPSDETFKLSVDDPSGLFNIPSTVTFTGHEVTAPLTVTFDPNKIETDKEYPVTITIEGAANKWGITTYSFVFDRKTPLEITNLGDGIFIYNALLEGGGYYNVIKTVNPNEPNIEVYTVEDWFDVTGSPEKNLDITVHTDVIMPNGYPYAEISLTSLGIAFQEFEELGFMGFADFVMWLNDMTIDDMVAENWTLYNSSGNQIISPNNVSYFDTDRGVFHIFDVYVGFNNNQYGGAYGPFDEYLYLPGYPDYDVEINYLGYFTNADDEITAMGELYAGEDVETVDVYNVAGDDVQEAIEAILNGEIEGETITPENTDAISVKFNVPGAGTYTMIAIANGNGEAQGFDYATYTISGGAAEAGNWKSIGSGIYIDGWVMPAYSISGVQLDPFKYGFNVEIEKNLDFDGQYRMVSPYTSEEYPLVDNNASTKKTNIVFDIADPDFPTVAFQSSGYKFSYGMMWIADYNWYLLNCAGYESPDDVFASSKVKQNMLSYYEGGVLEIPLPMFAVDDNDEMSSKVEYLGYNWRGPGANGEPYPAQLTMPAGSKGATAAKAIRHAVSADRFLQTIKAVNTVGNVHNDRKRNQPVTFKKGEMLKMNTMQLR